MRLLATPSLVLDYITVGGGGVILLGISRSLSQSQNTLTLNTLFLNEVDVRHTE